MKHASLIQLITSKTLIKKVTPFLLSVSVFSFIFSNPSWYSFLFRFFKFYFSSLPMQFLSHALDKNWIFLICNGILVVIANTSAMVHSPSGFDLNDLLQKIIGEGLLALPTDTKDTSSGPVSEPENEDVKVEREKENDATQEGGAEDQILEEEQEENSCLILDCEEEEEEEEKEQERELPITRGDQGGAEIKEIRVSIIMGDEENEEEPRTWFVMEEEDQDQQLYEDEEEGIDKLSTEEPNKKFDDFIRKMKEELRIEAQQHLVLVK